ncbi:MAG TPA: TrbG/VirB9 family P-type conjugative transfer protein [Allosphingosinicella sp.]
MRLVSLAAFALLAAAPAAAQVRPKPSAGDPHVQTVDYAADQVVLLQGAPGYQVTVELSPDEQVENVAVGDSRAWQVTPNRRGDLLFVKAMLSSVSTNLTIFTNVRTYNFELSPVTGAGDVAYTLRFRYPAPPAEDSGAGAAEAGRYRLSGDQALRPGEISDDGTHTYIRWPRDRSLPAVYQLTDTGQEALVNGMMREDDVFVIDSVATRLVFRVDKHFATATRVRARR